MLGGDNNSISSNTYLIKMAVLLLLCCQNAGHALMSRYSQGIIKESYSSSEVVIVGEILKLVFSAYCCITDHAESDAVGSGFNKLLWLTVHSQKIILLVVLYTINNMLAYYALARVDASVYTVILQLKIFTTAGFSVLILGRNISGAKWRALFLLVIGCILVASPTFNQCVCDVGITNRRALMEANSVEDVSTLSLFMGNSIKLSWNGVYDALSCTFSRRLAAKGGESDNDNVDSVLGIIAVLVMVTISGYAAVYFESMLKKTGEKITIWERNYQLALYSILFLVGFMVWEQQFKSYYYSDMEALANKEPYVPFKGWTINTVIIMLLQSGGGLLVAATLKYADAILKTLATCGSIVISAILGYFFLGGSLDIIISMGCISTILAICNYAME